MDTTLICSFSTRLPLVKYSMVLLIGALPFMNGILRALSFTLQLSGLEINSQTVTEN